MFRPSPLADAERALANAETFTDWKAAAQEYDLRSGGADWRREDESEYYDATLLRDDLGQLRALREAEAEACGRQEHAPQSQSLAQCLFQAAPSPGSRQLLRSCM